MAGDDWKPTVPERPSSREPKTVTTDAPQDHERPPAPSQRYVGGAEIARGGMGRVIEATDTVLARTVAVKEALTNDPETLRRFARETRITARLEHPSIVPVYDAGTDPAAPFYVMRRVTGRPLSGLISATESLDERLALIPHVLACAQAIAHAHKRGVIHRDIKPNNILVGELGETVVIDWGIAKVIGESDDDGDLPPMAGDSLRTRIGTVSGTPGFMSPEQARGDEIGASADVWALGATLYYLLTKQLPHAVHAKTPDDLLAHAAHHPVPPVASIIAGVPPDLAAITERALAFDAASRFPDAASFAEELSRFLTGQIVASHNYSVRERLVRWIKRHRAIVASGIVAIVAIAIVSTITIRGMVLAREHADEARRLAESAREKEQAHAESELLARARAIATTQPTAAIAALDQLPATSALAADADAIFATAISHGGAAWGLARNSGANAVLALDLTGERLMQLSHRGALQVWNLDRRELIAERTFDHLHEHPVWTAKGILIYGEGGTKMFDPATKQTTPFGSAVLKNVLVSHDGSRIAVLNFDGGAGWLDPSTGNVAPVRTERAEYLAMPRDGSWFATGNGTEVVLFDRAGREFFRHASKGPWLQASSSKHLVILEGQKLSEIEVAPSTTPDGSPTATWLDRPNPGIVWPEYLDETLVGRGAGTVWIYSDTERTKQPIAMTRIDGVSTGMSQVGSGIVGFSSGSTANELIYFDHVRQYRIPLPEALVMPRVTSIPGKTRVVVAGNASIIVLDLTYTIPRKRTDIVGRTGQLVSNEDIVAADDSGAWTLYAPDSAALLRGINLHSVVVDVSRKRVMFADRPLQPELIYVLDIDRMQIFRARANQGRLLIGGAIWIAGDKVFLRRDLEGEGREIATLKSSDALIVTDGARFRLFAGGEMVRGDVTSGVIERTPYELPAEGALLSVNGRLLVGTRKELHWDSKSGPLIATLEDDIDYMFWNTNGALVRLRSQITLYAAIGVDGTVTLNHVSSATVTSTGEAGRLVAPSASGTEMIELPSRRRWLHPSVNPIMISTSISPDGTKMLELGPDRQWWQWTLPPPQLKVASLRPATNAREQRGDRMLLWPWQTAR